MSYSDRTGRLGAVIGVITAASAGFAYAPGNEPNSQPNPYRTVENWATLPEGRTWGQVTTVDVDRNGGIWVVERCGGDTCFDRPEAPILRFDPTGHLERSFGAGMFVSPHGLCVDKDGNVWVTDSQAKNGRGQQVFKFSSDGAILLTLGKAGVAGDGHDTFNQPSDVAVAPDGDIFVADGHGGANSNARIVKFSKEGKFLKTWGKRGMAPGEFDSPHSLAFDSRGRLFVADRVNDRIQIFDQEGVFLEEWRQFGRPTGIFIDKNDTLYVADNDSNRLRNSEFKRGIRIGSARDGSVTAFIPDIEPDPDHNQSAAEGVAADAQGNIYGAEVAKRTLRKYVKK